MWAHERKRPVGNRAGRKIGHPTRDRAGEGGGGLRHHERKRPVRNRPLRKRGHPSRGGGETMRPAGNLAVRHRSGTRRMWAHRAEEGGGGLRHHERKRPDERSGTPRVVGVARATMSRLETGP